MQSENRLVLSNSVKVHSELHRLVTEFEDAHARLYVAPIGSQEALDAYAALSQRRKELYEWTMQRIKPFPSVYNLHMRF